MEWIGAKRNFGHVVLSVVLYHVYTRLFPNNTDLVPWATAIGFTMLSWQIVLWACVGLFYWLDTHPEFAHKYGFVKLPSPPGHTEPSWRTQTITSVRNMIFAFFLVPFLAYVINQGPPQAGYFRTGLGPFRRAENESYLRTMFWFFLYISIADVFFFCGHLLMHKWKNSFFHSTHMLHHSSSALCAISGYYMSPVDFILEHLHVFVAFYLTTECGPAWPVTICIGTLNLLTTHSGWNHPWLPDPVPHYLHHRRHQMNFGIVLDYVFGTAHTDKDVKNIYNNVS